MGRRDRVRYASRPLAVLVLAAGAGRRFGGRKPLARLMGRPMVLHVVDRALIVADAGVTVVSGPGAHSLRRELASSPVRVVHNPGWRQGQRSSLVAGLRALPREAAGVLVLLADQPGIELADLGRLRAAWRREPDHVIAVRHSDGAGAPAIFSRAHWPALTARAASGARGVPAGLPVRALRLSRPTPDIDNPLALARLACAGGRAHGRFKA
ncbi:MAG: nucleotidyltransferase family protein [Chromatiales bacterium]|nr:nucleotidyltransferase family protein [Chromatiales bacterium]